MTLRSFYFLSLIFTVLIFPTNVSAGPDPSALKNAQWCRTDEPAKARSKLIIDAAVSSEKADLAVAGYVTCQQHQLCAVPQNVQEKYTGYIQAYTDANRLRNELKDLDEGEFKKILGAFKKYAEPVLKLVGISCKDKNGGPIMDIERVGKAGIWLAVKCAAHPKDPKCK